MAFTISAAMAGAAGVLYAHNLSTLTANTNNFGYNMSIMILVLSFWAVSKYQRFDHSGSDPDTSSGDAPWIVRLPYADLCDRSHCHDAL